MKTQKELNENARKLAQAIVDAGTSSNNEAELKTSVSLALIDVARRLDLTLDMREEYTLINGRIDALYSSCIIRSKKASFPIFRSQRSENKKPPFRE